MVNNKFRMSYNKIMKKTKNKRKIMNKQRKKRS